MEKVLSRFREINNIRKNTVNVIILACPALLLFVGLNLLIIVFDEHAGSVVSNDAECAKIGKDMLKQGGSVVDAAIATMLCEGVLLPNRAGIGGGFTALLYVGGTAEVVTATPIVPKNFSETTFIDNKDYISGAKAGGTPGELLGYWEMHRKYGYLPWKDLIQPTIRLCEEGVPVTEWLELDMQRSRFYLYKNAAMRKLFFTLMNTREGNTFKFKALANTLRSIAKHGPSIFYHGEIGRAFVKDIQEAGGVLTMEDLINYNVTWSNPVEFSLRGGKRGFTSGLPSMGPAVAMVLNIMKSSKELSEPIFWHRTIEAMKHAFGMSYSLSDIANEPDINIVNSVQETFTKMISMDFAFAIRSKIKDDRILHDFKDYGVRHKATNQAGTSNICIISPTGQAIVLTSSLMWDFGTFAYSPKTGILLNTQLRSFAPQNIGQNVPQSPAQLIRAGKRAMSPHAPTLILDRQKAEIFFVVGASGSALIPSQVITAILNYCIVQKAAYYAANSGFFHPDPYSNIVYVSDPVGNEIISDDIIKHLSKAGHNLSSGIKENPYAIRTCIGHEHIKPDIQFTYHTQGGMEYVQPSHGFNTFLVIIVISLSLWILSWLIYEIVLLERENETLT